MLNVVDNNEKANDVAAERKMGDNETDEHGIGQ